jgi:hypothetical protein
MSEANPLQQYFRTTKIYIGLPSGTNYYGSDVVDFNDSGEIGIMPMTARDEMITKNPDALLNGDAILDIIKSCAPSIKDPKQLLANDVDAIMIGIRHATYAEDLEIKTPCPNCQHENTYTVDLSVNLAQMDHLDPEYTVHTESGVVIYVRPYTYKDGVSALKIQFEQIKASKVFAKENIDEDTRLALFSKSYQKISETNIELLINSIQKIVTPDGVEVTERAHIDEYMANLDKKTYKAVDNLISSINSIGVRKDFDATCEKCEHKWKSTVDFNPVNFFMGS